jgi:diguanylate cyclase (GGDEF)-like protein
MINKRKSLFTFIWLENLILSDLYLQSLSLFILLSFVLSQYWYFSWIYAFLNLLNAYTLLVYYEMRFRFKIRIDGKREFFIPTLSILFFFIGYIQAPHFWIALSVPTSIFFALIFVLFPKYVSLIISVLALFLELLAIQKKTPYWSLHLLSHCIIPILITYYITPLRWQRLFNALSLSESELNKINTFQKNHQYVYSEDLRPIPESYTTNEPFVVPNTIEQPIQHHPLNLLDTSMLEGNQIPSLNTISVAQNYELQNRMIEQFLKDAFDQELKFLADVYGLDHLAILWKRDHQFLEIKSSLGVMNKFQEIPISAFFKQALEQPFELVQMVKAYKYLSYLPSNVEVGAIFIQPIVGLDTNYEADGLLCVDRKNAKPWTLEEKLVFSAVVQRLKFYLQIALRMKGNVKEQDFTQKLCMGLKKLNHALDSIQVAQSAIQALRLYDHIDMVAFCIKERNVEAYRVVKYWMQEDKLSDRELSLNWDHIENAFCPLNEGLVADVIKYGKPIEQKKNLYSPLFNQKIGTPLFESLFLVPIRKNISHAQREYQTDIHEVYAVMVFGSHQKNAFTELSDQRSAIELITEQVEIKINLARAYETIKEMAHLDGLTGLKNHRSFQDEFDLLLLRSKRNLQPISLMILDLDHFKKINDTYGHPFGDTVLKALAQRLMLKMRAVDVIARYGGEEFVVILPETDEQGALSSAQRMLDDIRELAIPYQNKIVKITASIGIACSGKNDLNKMELIQYADQALYQAKNQGRNRIVLWENPINHIMDLPVTKPIKERPAEISLDFEEESVRIPPVNQPEIKPKTIQSKPFEPIHKFIQTQAPIDPKIQKPATQLPTPQFKKTIMPLPQANPPQELEMIPEEQVILNPIEPIQEEVIDYIDQSVPPNSLTSMIMDIPSFIPIEQPEESIEEDKIVISQEIPNLSPNHALLESVEYKQYIPPTTKLPIPKYPLVNQDEILVQLNHHPLHIDPRWQNTDEIPNHKKPQMHQPLPNPPPLSSSPPQIRIDELPQNNSTNYEVIPNQPILIHSAEIRKIEPEFNFNQPIKRKQEMPVDDKKDVFRVDQDKSQISKEYPKPIFLKNNRIKVIPAQADPPPHPSPSPNQHQQYSDPPIFSAEGLSSEYNPVIPKNEKGSI